MWCAKGRARKRVGDKRRERETGGGGKGGDC